MREICSYGSAGVSAGNRRHYPAITKKNSKAYHLSFRGQGFELWVFKQRAVMAKPVGVGFFGVDWEVAERTNLSH